MMNPIATVTSIQRIATTSDGDTLVLVDTDAPASLDFMLWNGQEVLLREGDAVTVPSGAATVSIIEAFDLTDDGDLAFMCRLGGVSSGQNEGLFLNGTLLLQKGDDASVAGFPAGSTFTDLDEIEMTADGAGNVEILLWVHVNTGSNRDCLLKINATTAGVVNSVVPLVTQDEIFDTTGAAVCPQGMDALIQVPSAPNRFAVNANGEAILAVRLQPSSADFTVLKGDPATIGPNAIAAREGCPTPNGTNSWTNLASTEVDINDAGDWVLTGTLNASSSSNLMIERSGAVFVQEGNTFPTINGNIQNFGLAPVFIAEDGEVIWYGEWNDPNPELGEAIFKGTLPLVQAGQTSLNGVLVDVIKDGATSFAASPVGDVVAFHAILEDGSEGVWRLGAGQPDIITEGIACGNQGTLSHVGGSALLGDGFTLRMDNGQGNGVLPILFFANRWVSHPLPYNPTTDCGFNWTFGNILLSVARRTRSISAPSFRRRYSCGRRACRSTFSST